MLTDGFAEGEKDRARDRILGPAPFRVPLYAQKKSFRLPQRHSLNKAVGRSGIRVKLWRKLIDALRM